MAVDPVGKKISEGELKLPVDNPAVMDAIRKGNIRDVHKLLSDYGITAADFEQFVSLQHAKYMSQVVQPEPLYELEATVGPPNIEMFAYQDPANKLDPTDLKIANQGIGKAMGMGKAEGGGTEGSGTGTSGTDIQNHLDSWDKYYDEVLNPQIIETQFALEYQNKSAELERELEKLVQMARDGQIQDPSVLILGITKVKLEQNGIIFTQLGKKIMNLQEHSNNIVADLNKAGSSDAQLMNASTQLKADTTTNSLLMQGISQCANYANGLLQFADGSIKNINNLLAILIKNVNTNG